MELLESEIRIQPPRQTHSPSVPPPPQKKTRDLPNLNECHACGFKADVCTGKNRLRPLYSEWRVVLLCKKCYFSVESSQICSYCFSGASPECFRCIKCKHSVHQSCFLKYKDVAPWSYACLGSDFSVCVDCWIPKPVAISRSRRRRGVSKRKVRVVAEKEGSRVLGDGNLVRPMEDVVRDAKKKIEAAARAREEATKKAELARRAVEIANKALSLVANKEDCSLNLHTKMGPVKVVDGAELSFELHSNLNGTPKIAKSWCLLNSTCFDAPKRFASGVDSSDYVFHREEQCKGRPDRYFLKYSRRRCLKLNLPPRMDPVKVVDGSELSEPSNSIGSLDTDSSKDLNCLYMGRSDMKTSSKDGECTAALDVEVIAEKLLKEGEGSCSGRLINFNGEVSGMDHDRQQTDHVFHREKQCKGRPDRYFWKYSRRRCSQLNLPPRMDPVKVVDGSELTFGLHPHLNGTPTISKSWCLLNTGCSDAPKRFASGVDSSFKISNSRNVGGCDDMHEVFNDIKLYKDSHKSLREPSVSIGSLDTDSSNDLNCLCMGRSDMKNSPKVGRCTAALDVKVIAEELLKQGEGSCSNRLINFNGEDCGMECDRKLADYAFHREERCQQDRYILKYSRRHCLKTECR